MPQDARLSVRAIARRLMMSEIFDRDRLRIAAAPMLRDHFAGFIPDAIWRRRTSHCAY